jgi:Kef-type K+ transport system membrane component KefB
MLFGFAIGPGGADLLPRGSGDWFPLTANVALVMVGFLLGGSLSIGGLREHGRKILVISGWKALVPFGVTAAGLLVLGARIDLALLLGAIATATDPAATSDVVREQRADGPLSRTLLGVVALDDAWGLVLFSVALAAVEAMNGLGGGDALAFGIRDVGGALLLGVILGVPAAYLTGRIDPGEPTLSEALGVIFLCGGLALWLEVSFLLASMVLGTTIASLAKHHRRPFHAIEGIEWPFMILFFVLAGASLDMAGLAEVSLLVGAYVALRAAGTWLGAWLGARSQHASPEVRRWLGTALLPQAGVALGMALVAAERLPERVPDVLPVAIAATAFFEIVGPVMTRLALRRAGEARASR